MGIKRQINRYEKEVLDYFGLEYKGLVWCEFGAQKNWLRHRSAKKVYEELGVDHTSIDLTGASGSLKLDLDYPLPAEMHNKFDVVTNYGTIEHVNNQYQVFKNAHDICKGIMIHAFPMEGSYPNHCRYYYNKDFVEMLVAFCGYSIHNMTISRLGRKKNLLLVVFKKNLNFEFISPEQFALLPLIDTGDTSRTGDYIIKHNERHRRNRPQ